MAAGNRAGFFSAKKGVPLGEYYQSRRAAAGGKPPRTVRPGAEPKAAAGARGKRRPAGKTVALCLALALLLLALSALLPQAAGQTGLPGALGALLGGASSRSPDAASSGMRLNNRPGGRIGLLSTEDVASRICPCVVGIVQYRKGSIGESGEGSGIVMSADGLILTNYHVIESAQRLVVVTRGKKEYAASVVGSDTRTDLAVVRIAAQNLPYATFGNASQCRVGEQVVAVGNPSGLQLAGSVTQGIISALNRNVDVGNGPMNLIQTDAAINPGNSGGALVNMYGQVVGINSAKIAQQGYEGLAFSIPVNTAKPVVDSILRYGYVHGRVRFGIACREMDQVTAQANGVPMGVYVDSVDAGGSAQRAGLKADDIILAVNGVRTPTTDALIIERDRHKPGETLRLQVYRRSAPAAGRRFEAAVALEEDRGTAGETAATGGW